MSNPARSTVASRRSYDRYVHTLTVAYRLIAGKDCAPILPGFDDIDGSGPQEILNAAVGSIRARLSSIDPTLCVSFLDQPFIQTLHFGRQILSIPIVNVEGRDWYTNPNVFNYDFLPETFMGMHHNARVIYDIGGHQGVYALYYSGLIEASGRVYTFEPSIINIEIAALSFLINSADNIVLVPMGVGPDNQIIRSDMGGLLVAGTPTNMLLVRPDWMMLERPDFIKIDIEGFEFEFVKAMPWLFDLCDNIHLEVHIPHLEMRGLDYREIISAIPFGRFRVVQASCAQTTEITATTQLEGYVALLLKKRC